MKLFFDFFPIVLFFVAYKFWGIYAATGVAIAASLVQLAVYWILHRRFEKMHWFGLIIITLLGGATLFLGNEIFIKWKPTVLYWALAVVFLVSQFFGKKALIQHMLENNMQLPKYVWSRLNLSWVVFFSLIGAINLYVIYHYDTDTWVNFKLFGVLGLTLLFAVLQGIYISKYMVAEERADQKHS